MKTVIIFIAYFGMLGDAFSTNFKKCHRKDTNFNECVKTAANHGIAQTINAFSELNLKSVDSLEISKLNVPPGINGIVAVEQKLQDCRLYGFSEGVFDEIIFDFLTKNLYFDLNVPEVKMLCYYDFNGKILQLPIVGKGRVTYEGDKVRVRSNFSWIEIVKGGKTYIQLSSPRSFQLDPQVMRFNFNNLYNGDKIRGDHMNKVLNDHWPQVYADLKDHYEKVFGLIFNHIFNDFFSKISIDDVFD